MLHLRCPFTLSASLRAEWYQRRRLNGSSDELPGFVQWRKFTGHNLSQGFSLCGEFYLGTISHTIADEIMSWFVLIFVFFEKAHHYHSSTRYKSRSSSIKRVQDRMQRLIFTAGIWSKNIITEATEAGLDINIYLFSQDSFHFAMAFLQTFPASSSSLFIAFLISWTSHHHITCRLRLPPDTSSTPMSLPHHYFISPWRLPSSLNQ